MTMSPWSKDVQYEVVKSGKKDAARPKVGELVTIRFKGSYKGTVFDDTFKTEQPYIYRTGVGLVLKGLDDAIINMAVGDRIKLSFGGELAFGEKGKPSAPGKPRIPPNAVIDYEVELVELPGQAEDFIADYEE
jgi:FKBP-type peptidyl-prolyl cis-trans isomerase